MSRGEWTHPNFVGDPEVPPEERDRMVGLEPGANGKQPDTKPSPLISLAEFAEQDHALHWLIKSIMVERQPVVVGGAIKTMKTSVVCDLAISLGSDTKFLGEFWTQRQPGDESRRVGLISGESGEATIDETTRRICKARGITRSQVNLFLGFEIPRLSDASHLGWLAGQIRDHELSVVILDPLYLALLAGGVDVQASNMFQMGPLFLNVTRTCLDAGATPILVHHTRQRAANEKYQPPQLEDLAYSGAREFARQWIMLGRREAYEEGTGQHALWLSVGGSAGHSGLWAVEISEDVQDEEFSGRRWEVSVSSGRAAKAESVDRRERQKEESQHAKTERTRQRHREAVLKVMAAHPDGETRTVLREEAGMSSQAFGPILHELKTEGIAEPCQVEKNGQEYDGFRLAKLAPGLTRTHPDCPTRTHTHPDTHTPGHTPRGCVRVSDRCACLLEEKNSPGDGKGEMKHDQTHRGARLEGENSREGNRCDSHAIDPQAGAGRPRRVAPDVPQRIGRDR